MSASVGDPRGLVRKSNELVIAVAPKLVPSDQASRWTRNQAPRSPAVWSTYHWNPMNPIGARIGALSDHQSRLRRMARKLATAHAATSAIPFGRAPGRDGGEDAGEHPSFVDQEPQACRGEHDQHRFGVGERQHEASGEHGEQRHGPCRDRHRVEAAGEQADEHDSDGTEHEVDEERRERVATRQHDIDGTDRPGIDGEERGACLQLFVGDVGRDRVGITASYEFQVPAAVPRRQHVGDRLVGGGFGDAVLACVDGHLRGAYAGGCDDAHS